jgi:hypothetical protein
VIAVSLSVWIASPRLSTMASRGSQRDALFLADHLNAFARRTEITCDFAFVKVSDEMGGETAIGAEDAFQYP